LALISI